MSTAKTRKTASRTGRINGKFTVASLAPSGWNPNLTVLTMAPTKDNGRASTKGPIGIIHLSITDPEQWEAIVTGGGKGQVFACSLDRTQAPKTMTPKAAAKRKTVTTRKAVAA
jgi:hypothetical protein